MPFASTSLTDPARHPGVQLAAKEEDEVLRAGPTTSEATPVMVQQALVQPAYANPAVMLQLQRTAGNQAVARLLHPPAIPLVVSPDRAPGAPDIQCGKEKDDDEDFIPASARRQRRYTFPKPLRQRVLKKAPKNIRGLHVCSACGRPIGGKDLSELKFKFTSKSGKLHTTSALALDHFDPKNPKHGSWADRLAKLELRHATDDEIKQAYMDESKLRPICKVCNESHKYETTDLSGQDYSSEDYLTDDEEPEMKGYYKQFRT